MLTMVYQFQEWNPGMLAAVENELAKRNRLPGDIAARKEQLIREEDEKLSQGKEASAAGLIIGWICILGLVGIFMGYNYTFSRTYSLYTRKKYYTYDKESRQYGSYLFYTAVIVWTLFILYRLLVFTGITI